jgi:hypothetical protein
MIDIVKESLWEQFGASIDMLKNAIVMWPDETWESKPKAFRMAFHTLFFLEFYFTNPPDNFKPTLAVVPEGDDDLAPARIYSKKEMLEYLEVCRAKCKREIYSFNENNLDRRWLQKRWNREFNYYELMMYNMRHVQHHAAQLNMMLRNEINDSPDWVSRVSDPGL